MIDVWETYVRLPDGRRVSAHSTDDLEQILATATVEVDGPGSTPASVGEDLLAVVAYELDLRELDRRGQPGG